MIINVTKEDIENGEPRDNFNCPIQLAIKRTTGLLCSVGKKSVSFRRRCIQLPDVVQKRIAKFDSTSKMKPFSFTLKISQRWINNFDKEEKYKIVFI